MNTAPAGGNTLRMAPALAAATLAMLLAGFFPATLVDDTFHRWLQPAPQSPPAPVLVLGVEASDPWPWSNERLASVLQHLHDAGVAGIGLDLPLQADPSGDPVADARLARALADDQVVLGLDLDSSTSTPVQQHPLPIQFATAARLGHVRLPPDRDGRVRRHLSLALDADGVPWPSLAEAMARPGASPARGMAATGGWRVPHDGTGPPMRNAADVLEGRIPSTELKGRWVLLGRADPARQARLPGPYGTPPLFPVQHQARALAALLQGPVPRPLPLPLQAVCSLLLAGWAVYAAWPSRPGPARRLAAVFLLSGILAALALSAGLFTLGYWFAPGASVCTLALVLSAWLAIVLQRQWRRRRRLPGLANRGQLLAALQAAGTDTAPHALLLLEPSPSGTGRHGVDEADTLKVAELLRTRARRPEDLAAWLGGSRFALLLHGASATAAEDILGQIRGLADEQGLVLAGDIHACGTDGCQCRRHLVEHAGGAR